MKKRAIQPLEATILHSVLHLLSVHPKVAWARRMNTGALPVQDRFLRFGFRGCSDILGQLKDGRLLAFEVKRPGKALTADQKAFLERVNRHHGLGACIHSVDEADEVLRGWGRRELGKECRFCGALPFQLHMMDCPAV